MFITVEGIEGVGKTTHLEFMAEQLSRAGISVVVTREPGGTPMGEEIRDILLAHRYERVIPLTELLLMFAARAQHIDTVIRPALDRGRWVLCDRFVDATYAYQGGGRGVSIYAIRKLEKLVLGDLAPDCTFIFHAPIEVALKRVKKRASQDRFEREDCVFFERAQSVYLRKAAKNKKRYKVIDTNQPIALVEKILLKSLFDLIELVSGR